MALGQLRIKKYQQIILKRILENKSNISNKCIPIIYYYRQLMRFRTVNTATDCVALKARVELVYCFYYQSVKLVWGDGSVTSVYVEGTKELICRLHPEGKGFLTEIV